MGFQVWASGSYEPGVCSGLLSVMMFSWGKERSACILVANNIHHGSKELWDHRYRTLLPFLKSWALALEQFTASTNCLEFGAMGLPQPHSPVAIRLLCKGAPNSAIAIWPGPSRSFPS